VKKIGFFGGSFNPPTIAHFEIVKKALKEFKLDKIIIIPMGDKYEKKDLIPFKYRYEMLDRMFEVFEDVDIWALQANQQNRMYAIDTFDIIDEEYKDFERFFIMGLDNFINIKKWKSSNKLLQNRNYIIFRRNNIQVNENIENVKFLDVEQENVSSSMVRAKIKLGEDLNGLLTPIIIKYINQNGLYK